MLGWEHRLPRSDFEGLVNIGSEKITPLNPSGDLGVDVAALSQPIRQLLGSAWRRPERLVRHVMSHVVQG